MLDVMTPVRTVLGRWRRIAADGEQQMVVNRLVAGIFALSFNYWALPRGLMSGFALVAPCLYIFLGGLIAAHLLARLTPSVTRRLLALILDCAGACYELHIGGGATVWQFAGYLWIIFGNGFRFGSRFQVYAMLIATAGFAAMAAVTPYWREQPAELFGGLISLTVVPVYALALIKRLSQATRQAEEANRAKSLFLASVSHELRTPLNAVIGMGALLESSELKPEQIQMSRTIMTAARSLLSLIDGILDLSRAEAGRMSIARGDFDLAQLLNEIQAIFIAQGRLKGVQVDLHVTARTPRLLYGDGRKLHEILLNLVGNAMKFTATGSITLGVDAVEWQDGQVRLRIEVTDTGIGIAPEAHERIFEAFTQADATVVNSFGGTGLGLALVRKSVELLGGEIGVQSALGAGSTFWFELPMQCQAEISQAPSGFAPLHALVLTRRPDVIAPLLGRLTEWGVRVEHVEAAAPGWPEAADANALGVLAFTCGPSEVPQRPSERRFLLVDVQASGTIGLPDAAVRSRYTSSLAPGVSDAELRNVLQFVLALQARDAAEAQPVPLPVARESFSLLVADDNATNRLVLDAILRSAGHRVTLVNNGEQALDALADTAFDAAVLDVNMPLMNGIEAAKTYRMITGDSELIPLIALTADATPVTREECLAAGMAACLVKPVEPASLLAIIDEMVAKTRSLRPKPVVVADPRITEISTHPRFRGNAVPAVDFDVLAGLRGLGDAAFLREVIELFGNEARDAVAELRVAASRGDVLGFRTHAHALRSVAANIGARILYDICMPLQIVSGMELRQQSSVWLEQIAAELSRVEVQLAEYCSRPEAQARS